jgi:predicted GNAT family N-acyltransferase
LTGYDQQHLVAYLRLLDADAEGADRAFEKVITSKALKAASKKRRPRRLLCQHHPSSNRAGIKAVL